MSNSTALDGANREQQSSREIAVVYFSCTGRTEAVAQKVSAATNGKLMRIIPEVPYTSADLDYNSDCRANTEQNNPSTRPALGMPIPDVASCDTVYLGYPIWWGSAPRIIFTYLEAMDLSGKTVIPFCTSGSSPISGSINELHKAVPQAAWQKGTRFAHGVSQQEVDAWVESL